MIGAILRQTVPATIIRSDCRGDARNTPAPYRSMSCRDDTEVIISIAQHAKTNVMGQSDDLRAQLITESTLVVISVESSAPPTPIPAPPFSRHRCTRRAESQ